MNPQPIASIALQRESSFEKDFIQLNRPSFMYGTFLAISAGCDVAFSCSGLVQNGDLDLATALRAGLLELVDERTQTAVAFPPPIAAPDERPATESFNVHPEPLLDHGRPALVHLVLDSTAQLWKDVLTPETAYRLRLSASGGEAYCHRRVQSRDGATETDTTEKLAVRREAPSPSSDGDGDGGGGILFTVYADPAPPTFGAVFGVASPPDGLCHNSSTTPPEALQRFAFVVEMTNAGDRPVTVCTEKTAFGSMLPFGGLSSVEELVHCVDDETVEEVDFPYAFQCFDSDPWGKFPEDAEFVEVEAGGTWRFEYELGRQGQCYCLDAGRRYRAELSRVAKLGFHKWMYGRKEELLWGTEREKIERWRDRRGRGDVRVEQVNGPVVFDVVE